MAQQQPDSLRSTATGFEVPTIRVKHAETGEEIVINKDDFDGSVHERITKRPAATTTDGEGDDADGEKATKKKKA